MAACARGWQSNRQQAQSARWRQRRALQPAGLSRGRKPATLQLQAPDPPGALGRLPAIRQTERLQWVSLRCRTATTSEAIPSQTRIQAQAARRGKRTQTGRDPRIELLWSRIRLHPRRAESSMHTRWCTGSARDGSSRSQSGRTVLTPSRQERSQFRQERSQCGGSTCRQGWRAARG